MAGSVYSTPMAITEWTGVLSSPTKLARPTEAVRRPSWLISVCASTYSFQPWKKAITEVAASDGATSGSTTDSTMPTRVAPSMRAASSISSGTPSMAPFRIQVMTGTVKAVLARISPPNEFSSPTSAKMA